MKKILFATSEAVPFAATGGLADVCGSLPAALKRKGADVRVVMPLYSQISEYYREKMHFLGSTYLPLSWRWQYCGIFSLEWDGVTVYFIDNEYYFKRQSIYGSFDDGERFAFFGKAILELIRFTDFFPDILHTNDWQTACAAIYLRISPPDARYRSVRSVHTIHNIEYQGIYPLDISSDLFGFPEDQKHVFEYYRNINLTKGAIVCCDILTTVSPKYADEILSDAHSFSLGPILRDNSYKIRGILNGIDTVSYSPEIDRAIYENYTTDNFENKYENKRRFQEEMHLPQKSDVPLFAMITRLADHKGIDIMIGAVQKLLEEDLQFVLLGTGDERYENYFKWLEGAYRDKVRSIIKFDSQTARKIYAAADIFVMPSRSEPCGLAQMIACRYGTIPVVRETGGLFDSIKFHTTEGLGKGFTFYEYNPETLLDTLWKATTMYHHDREDWVKLAKYNMTVDLSWDRAADKYMELYYAI